LCTCNFAEYLYDLADIVKRTNSRPPDPLCADFYQSMGIGGQTSLMDAVNSLIAAGDRMLDAILRHADQLHLSEQFDR
jgi:hypothetical protein